MFPFFQSFKKSAARMIATASLAGFLAIPAYTHLGPPIQMSIASADNPRVGEPSTIYVVMEAGADVAHAEYSFLPPAGWQIIDGQQHWAGAVQKGQKIQFVLKAIPLSENPGDLKASFRVSGDKRAFTATLNPDRMGDKFPEEGTEDENARSKDNSRFSVNEEEPIQPNFIDGTQLPEPANATRRQLPGQPVKDEPILEAQGGKNGNRAAAVSIQASGRFTYLDDQGVRRGIRNATVELWNENPAPSFGDERCARGITDADGNFSLGANCGDLFDGPDLFMRIVLNNSAVEVKADGLFGGTYTFRTATKLNSPGGAVNFGTITVTSNRAAYQTHNLIMRANQFMATVNESMEKVTVNFPGDGTFYNPFFKAITVTAEDPFDGEGDVFHEYGHHILNTKAESPAPDYDNGICDDPTPGHCIFAPENGVISWTEGWPNYFGALMHANFNAADGYGPTRYQFETRPDPFQFPGEEDKTEGIIAALLWDLTDNVNDDQGEQGAGRRDNISLGFTSIWNVIKNFDPSNDAFHNHPTSIHELWDGLRAQRRGDINRISEAYREHNIVKPQPDLEVTSVENPPTRLGAGASFSLSNTVRNSGNELANSSATVRIQLQNVESFNGRTVTVNIGSRTTPANFSAGSNSSAATVVTLPTTVTAGTYRVRVCADSAGVVPESDESNNCMLSSGATTIQ